MLTEESVEYLCAVECQLQGAGPLSVYHMLCGWQLARFWYDAGLELTIAEVLELGHLIEPRVNANGFRRVPVRLPGGQSPPHPTLVFGLMERLVEAINACTVTPEEAFREFEEIHPFQDGNGRVGQIIYNWARSSLGRPEWAPDLWHDARRVPGYGAPRA